jgi:Acyclic terpene utilisation family protein AtuA
MGLLESWERGFGFHVATLHKIPAAAIVPTIARRVKSHRHRGRCAAEKPPPETTPMSSNRRSLHDGRRCLRIGGASGFWGDSMVGAPQLVASGAIDVLVFDYLAETTMSVLAAARAKKPELGYATDFVEIAMKSVLPEVMRRGIKVIANAGGIHPEGCAQALRALAASMGLAPRIAVVLGDDISAQMPALREAGVRDMFSGDALPAKVLSANAYLGALPVARALAEGAHIVITGRCVDSAVTLGALIHAFGWAPGDHDRLAGGSLAGHIIECGCQATGGLFTDWDTVVDWANIGYPIVDCFDDGSFEVSKPAGTGGLIHRAAVAEQLLYEIGDPGAYVLPDVVCDFRHVHIEQVTADRVRVSGATGRAPTATYKVSATQLDGYRCAGSVVIVGIDAPAKARRTGEAIIQRTSALLAQQGLAPYTSARVELLGCEGLYGPHSRAAAAREVMVRVVVDHPSKAALEIFAREIAPAGTSWSPGTTMPSGGRPSPSPLIKPFAFLLDKSKVSPCVRIDDRSIDITVPPGLGTWQVPAPLVEPVAWTDHAGERLVEVPLVKLAWGRSGDKGNLSNIGLIARRPEWLPLLWARVTPEVVARYFAHLAGGPVDRYLLPGLAAMNLVVYDALAGGGPASPRFDPLGKGMAQMLLDLPVAVPASVAAQL